MSDQHIPIGASTEIVESYIDGLVGAVRVYGPFEFAYNTPGLADGIEFFTGTAGDILIDAQLFTPAGWNGTTPRFDLGPITAFGPGNIGLYRVQQEFEYDGVALDITTSDLSYGWLTASLNPGSAISTMRTNNITLDPIDGGLYLINGGSPWKYWVSQDGLMGGAAPGGSAGTAKLYLFIATPGLP